MTKFQERVKKFRQEKGVSQRFSDGYSRDDRENIDCG